jgi:uncharacterized delta-60 repeat protein
VQRATIQNNGKVLISGNFESISNNFPAAGIARLNTDGSPDMTFSGIPGGKQVRTVALFPDGRIAVGGNFSTFNLSNRTYLAVLQGDLVDPAFLRRPVPLTVQEGSEATLSASVSSILGATFQWYRNGLLLAGETNSTLTLASASLSDNGVYTVVATAGSSTNSASAQVTVIGRPYITKQPQPAEAWEGGTLNLSVSAIGSPVLSYQWTRDGSALLNATNDVLSITNISFGQSGSYTVEISNASGSTTSAPAHIVVITRPGSLVTNWVSAFPNGGSATMTAAEALPDGKFLIAGNELYGNAPYLFRINANGSLDPSFNSGLSAGVGTGNLGKFALDSIGRIYLQRASSVQRHNSGGTLEAAFAFRGISGVNLPSIADLCVTPDQKLLVAGNFLRYGNAPVSHLIRLNQDGSLDAGFMPVLFSNVTAVAVQPDRKVLIGLSGGVFSPARVLRLLPNGAIDPAFSTNTWAGATPGSGLINKIRVLAAGRIYIGGNFNMFGAAASGGLVRLHPNGDRDWSFNAPSDASARDIVVQANGRVIVAGWNANKPFRRYEPNGELEAKFIQDYGPVSSGVAYAVALAPSGKILAVGNFNGWNFTLGTGVARTSIALLHGDPVDLFIHQHPLSQTAVPGGGVVFTVGVSSANSYTLQWLKDGSILEGQTGASLALTGVTAADDGHYSVVATSGGLSRTSHVAALFVQGTPTIIAQPSDISAYLNETAFLSVGAEGAQPMSFVWRRNGVQVNGGTNSYLYLTNLSFAAAGDYEVVVSNSFGAVTSHTATLAVSIRQGGRDGSFVTGSGFNSSVQQLLMRPDGSAYFVGNFGSYNGVARQTIALLNADGTLSTTFSNALWVSGSISASGLQSDGRLVLGGGFFSWGGISTPYLARFETNGALDTNFTARLGAGLNQAVTALAIGPDDKIVVVGNFSSADNQPRNSIARWNADGSLDYGFVCKTNISYIGALMVQPDGKIIVAALQGLFRLHTDGSVDLGFTPPALPSSIATMVRQPDGKVLLGGAFTPGAGQPNRYITRLNANGTVDSSFNPGTNIANSVSRIVVQEDGRILITGSFTTVSGEPRNYVARLNSNGSLDTSFLPGAGPAGGSPMNPVIGLQYNGRILLAGGFTSYDGAPAPYVAGVYGEENSFAITNQPVARVVNAGNDATFVVGAHGSGPFTYQWFFNGQPVTGGNGASLQIDSAQTAQAGLYHVVVTKGSLSRTSSAVVLTVRAEPRFILQPSSFLVREGSNVVFQALAEGAEPLVYQWHKNGMDLPGQTTRVLNIPGAGLADAAVYSLVASNSYGAVETLPAVLSVAALAAGSLDVSFGSNGPNSEVRHIAVATNGSVYIAGYFSQVDSQWRQYLARLTPSGRLDTNYTPAMPDNIVHCLALQPDGKLLIGGNFSWVGQHNRNGIARLNQDGTVDTTFTNFFNYGAVVYSIAILTNGQVLAAGQFTTVDGISRPNLARLNSNGSLDTSWGNSTMANNYVQSLSVQEDGRIVIGGGFTSVLGTTRRQVARLMADGTLDTSFDPGNGAGTSPSVMVVSALKNGQVMVGGTFTVFNSMSRSRLVRLNDNGSVDTNFNANLFGSYVSALNELPDGRLLVGGNFYITHDGQTASGFMRFLTNGVADANFRPGSGINFGAAVNAIAPLADGKTLIGGSFTSWGAQYKPYLVRLAGESATTPIVTITPSNASAAPGSSVFLSAIATGMDPLRLQWRKEGLDLPGQTNTFLLLTNLQVANSGAYTVVVSNTFGAVTSAVAIVSVGSDDPFADWAAARGLTAANDAPDDDADNDGVLNIFEYYFGTLPLDSNSGAMPILTTVTSGPDTYPALTFIRSQSADGVVATVRVSSNASFTDELGSIMEAPQPLGNGLEAVTVRSSVSMDSWASQFMVLQLSRP